MEHYINTGVVDLSLARSVSLLNPMTPRPFPVLGYGDSFPHEFFFHENGVIEHWSGDATNGLRVTLGEVGLGPFGGSYTLTCGETTAALDYNSTAEEVEAALNGLATVIAAGYLDVTGDAPNFQITWRTVGAKTTITASAVQLVPVSGVSLTVLQTGTGVLTQRVALTLRREAIYSTTTFTPITTPEDGWSGSLSTNTAGALALLMFFGETVNEFVQAVSVITVERIQADGNYQTVYQAPFTLRAKNVDLGATSSSPFANSLLLAVQNRSTITGLASASADATKLAGLPTASSAMPAGAILALNFAVSIVNDDASTTTGTLTLLFQLQASTAATSAPTRYRPYDYNASTNAVSWVLLGAWMGFQPASYNSVTGKFHRTGAYGSADAVTTYADQKGTANPT